MDTAAFATVTSNYCNRRRHCVRLPLELGPKDPEKRNRAPRCFPVKLGSLPNNEGLLRGRSQLRAAARGAGPEAADVLLLCPMATARSMVALSAESQWGVRRSRCDMLAQHGGAESAWRRSLRGHVGAVHSLKRDCLRHRARGLHTWAGLRQLLRMPQLSVIMSVQRGRSERRDSTLLWRHHISSSVRSSK